MPRDKAARERRSAKNARTELAKIGPRLEAVQALEKENERLKNAVDAERLAAISKAKASEPAGLLADANEQHGQNVANLERQLQDQKQRCTNLEADLSVMRKEALDLATGLA